MAGESEQTRKRLLNQSRILDALRVGKQVQRTELSKSLGIRNSSITSICKDLLDRGALTAVTPGAYRSPLSLNTEFWRTAVLSICDHQISGGIVDCHGNISNLQTELQSNVSPKQGLATATKVLKKLLSEESSSVRGVGVSITGITDPEQGVVRSAINLSSWQEVPVARELSDNLGTPVTIRNDASCGLLGNCWFQEWGKQINSALYVCIGTGIGTAYSVNRELATGAHFSAGEIGCLPAGNENRACTCGKNRDCLQTYCAVPALLDALVDFDSRLKGKSFEEICADPTPAIKEHLSFLLKPLIDKVTTLSAFLDPDAVILTTPQQAALPLLVEVLGESLRCHLPYTDAEKIALHQGFPTLKGVLLGAASNVFTRCFKNQSLTLET